jgi:hypothetical protein
MTDVNADHKRTGCIRILKLTEDSSTWNSSDGSKSISSLQSGCG